MKIIAVFLVCLFSTMVTQAQRINQKDVELMQKAEDSMKLHAIGIIRQDKLQDRFRDDSIFTRMLVRTLKVPYSFYYPFDSLQSISLLYAPDSSFRIFTWEMVVNENLVRQHGAIQMRTTDGSLKLFPLIDKSDVTVRVA